MVLADLERDDVLLLLLLALSEGTKQEVPSITRIEKLMFLLQKETAFSGKLPETFSFVPWKFGPFSQQIYEDLDLLVSLDLVQADERELQNYVDYTEEEQLLGSEPEEPIVERIFSAKTFRTFASTL